MRICVLVVHIVKHLAMHQSVEICYNLTNAKPAPSYPTDDGARKCFPSVSSAIPDMISGESNIKTKAY